MIEFIFMLTRDDVTLADARAVYASVAGTGLRHVGCKDVGLSREELAALMDDIQSHGHETYLEVVSETDEATLESARVAAEIRPDHLIGGTLIEPVQEILEGTGVRFWPYVGRIVGHPCLLRGTIDEIVADTERAAIARASTASTCSPTATTATSRRWSARWSAPPTCRSSAPARSTASSGSERWTRAGRRRSRSARPLWMGSSLAGRSTPSSPRRWTPPRVPAPRRPELRH